MNLVTPMEAYATTDGQLFHDLLEAQAHQFGLDITPEIEAYLGRDFLYTMHGSTRKDAILNWEVTRKLKELQEEK
jgi:hypothetical protein